MLELELSYAIARKDTKLIAKELLSRFKAIKRALYNHAVGVIISHNHPAGTLEPSQDDRATTKAIKEALKTIDINSLDHIIIGNNDYFSFMGNGIEI